MGIGFYSGAIITTILIYITLIVLKQIESHVKKSTYNTFYIEINNQQMSHIYKVFEAYNASIKNTEIISNEQENYTVIKIVFKTINNQNKLNIISDLYKLEGIKKVYEEN